MFSFFKNKKSKGMAMVEILIGSFILSVGILAVSEGFSNYVNYALANQKNIQASYLLEEALEVMSIIRDDDWINFSSMSTTTDYYIVFDGVNWNSTTTEQYVDGDFLRKINISDVYRNENGMISDFGTNDLNIKKITATVEYSQGHSTTTKSISTYLANIHN